jgi:Fur family transcriptional regulator, ferric uptake regulator
MKRKTSQRIAIEQVMSEHDRPLGVEEILSYGRESVESLNLATVYRNIKLLVEKGVLKQIHHPTLGTFYELTDELTGKKHHDHFYCHVCGRIFDLSGCVLRKDKLAPDGFVVEYHEAFLFGMCVSCVQP